MKTWYAMNELAVTQEKGEDPKRFQKTWMETLEIARIKQVASGRFEFH
jgi:glutamate synthase domain-containing protein 2